MAQANDSMPPANQAPPAPPTFWEALQAILNGPTEMRKMRNRALDAADIKIPGATIAPASPPRTIAQALSEIATNPEARTPANAAALMSEGGKTFAARQDVPLSGPVNADLVRRGIQQTAAGFNTPIGRLISAPGDAIQSGIDAILGQQRPPGANGQAAWNRLFVDPSGPPVGTLEKTLRAGGEAAGTALPLFAGGAGLASAGRGVAGVLRGQAGNLIDWIAANPATTIATGTHAAFSSGSASQRARAAAQQAGFIDQGPANGNGVTQ
jgi:hypothetical protein